MIILAHDGSIYSEWVSNYAVMLAGHKRDRKILVLHALENTIAPEIVDVKLSRLRDVCLQSGVSYSQQLLPVETNVYRTLRQAIPHNPESLLICGTRVKPYQQSFLKKSISEKLLKIHQCPVLAIRVVQPGLLGCPDDVLIPLAGHLDGFKRVWPIFSRFAHGLKCIHLFRVLPVHEVRHLHMTPERERVMREAGSQHLKEVIDDISRHMEMFPFRVDPKVVISSDWVNEVLVQASRLKVQLMLLGVSERSLAYRTLHGDSVEKILSHATCDVGIYRGP